ncbi:PilN domain-containing protein [Nitrococcus mobilis]|uniref:Fimbrial assembly membrane protein n=1 Tax=Nitrococcus mobilis Nb-231 TaxID=314278 RepID=A4BQU5_9GAMM|nr:PilN domain-containing protein [Nitrococcus mobilis]EAR21945.1 fimbrial assembly membrane protein [Nitrococcus mobilis Nb-231]
MAIHINLLPWREELRKQRERIFYGMLAASVLLGAVVWLLTHTELNGRIDYQHDRNQFLKTEIAQLDKKIVKIRKLEATKKRLIARMEVIQKLQQGRPQIVHLFHQFVTTLPDGLYLTSIKEQGSHVTVTGVAESNARVSNYMENLDGSHWLTDPDLNVIEVKDRSGFRTSNFTLAVQQTSPAASKTAKEGS